ncbi:MAG: ATP-binding protein [Candidatus Coprovivens sp.]
MIKRELYLSKIRPFYESDLIKVIVGIRRSGKSTIMMQIMDELKNNNISEKQIIYINFEYKEYSFIKNDDDLYEYIKSLIKNDSKYYIFLDEIQNVSKWEKVVNSFKSKEKYSIFITGSNSDLLSGELATHIAGRYVSFKVYPFKFSEVCDLKELNDKNKYELQESFDNYIKWGGLPQRFEFESDMQIRTYLSDVYDSIIVKDIIDRFKIKDLDLFNRIVEYIVTTPSETFSAETLANYFLGKEERGVAKNTLYNYLEYMVKGNLINKCERYDIRGKRILSGKYKYYLSDLGLGMIKNVNRRPQMVAYLENVVYNELLVRGYDVSVGNIQNGEVDFVATKDNNIEYYQVTYTLSTDEVIGRKFGAYKSIEDNYPKYVISTDTFDMSQNGIIHKNIIDWLLNK